MKAYKTAIDGVMFIGIDVFEDNRGFFYESYNRKVFKDTIGIEPTFVQNNFSYSKKNVLRGLHYQIKHPQAKLVDVLHGEITDVIVDLRPNSKTFKRWERFTLYGHFQLFVPEGCAHGFYVHSDTASVLYHTTDHRYPEYERTLAWNDPELNIQYWREKSPILSEKDSHGLSLKEALDEIIVIEGEAK